MGDLGSDTVLPLVGRRSERDLLEALSTWLAGGPGALLLVGDAGIGKTSLWTFGVRVAAPDTTVLTSRPAELDRQVAYSGLAELFDGLDDEIERLPDPSRRALGRALQREHGSVEAAEVAAAAAALVDELSQTRPVILAIDDLPWLDRSTARVIGYVARRLEDKPVGLLACQRGDGANEPISGSVPPDRVRRITVTGLDQDDLGEMIRRRLGANFLRPMVARIHAVSGGNPFYALELARSVLRMPGPTSSSGPLPVSASLDDLIGRRLAALPAASRDVLLVVAMAEPATVALLETIAGAHVRSALQRSLDAGVVRIDAGRIRFTHPLLAETTYSGADPARRRHLHLALAEVTDDLEVRARHLAAGTGLPDASVAAELEAAGDAACGRGAPDSAAELFRLAADLTPADEVHAYRRRALVAAQQLARVGRSVQAEQIFRRLAVELSPGPQRAMVLQQIGMLERGVGSWLRAIDTLGRASDEAGPDPALQAEIEQQLAGASMQAIDLRDAVQHVRLARKLAAHGASARTAADIEVTDLMHRVASGVRPPPGCVERLVSLATAAIDVPPAQDSTMRLVEAAATLKWLDEFDAARDLLERLGAILWERQQDGLLMPVLFQLAELECWSGRTERAERLAEIAVQTRERAGQDAMSAMSTYTTALIAARLGNLTSAREAALRCQAEATRSGDARNRMRALTLQGFVALSDGRAEDAVAPLDEAWHLERQLGYDNPAVIRGAADHVEALLAVDRVDDARRCVQLLVDQAGRIDNPWTSSAARRARGLLAASTGDLAAAVADLESDAEDPHLVDPLERGRTLLSLGVVRRRSGRRAAAREATKTALATLCSVRATAWQRLTEEELGRLDNSSDRSDGLTTAEAEIADLITSGLTNKETAAAIHVSVKTVEAHLTHIYRKLGVHSRTQLAAWVTDVREQRSSRDIPDASEPAGSYAERTRQTNRRHP